MARIEFRLLGPLEVRGRDGPLPLGGAKQRAVLALLLLHSNRVLGRDRLIDELWGENPPKTAVTTLQVYVSRLRKVLPEGTLVTRSPGYLLEIEPESVDLRQFERLVIEAHEADPGCAAALLDEALALWHGAPLAEFGDLPFVRVERARLEELRLAASEERTEAELALGRHAELVGELETLIIEAPHRERLRAQLMLALYRSDRQADALAAFRATRAALDELGIEPSVALRELERRILAQDPALELQGLSYVSSGGEAALLPGALIPTPPFPFVGRTRELADLDSLLTLAEKGEGGFVLLAGEAGAGKTRLVRELAHKARARGVLVLYGASDAAVSVPYQPIREWGEFLMRVSPPELLRECLGNRGAQASRLVPELAALTEAPADDSETDRHILQGAVVEFLRELSANQPLLLVADDVHWSDSETPLFLRRLARTAPEARMLVVVVFRHQGEQVGAELSDALVDLSRLDGVSRFTLANLSNDEVGEFIRESTKAEAAEGLASAIGQLTSGSPLLLCELWRNLLERRAVEVSHERVQLSRPFAELRGSDRLHDVVRQRLVRLSPDAATLLELAAVAGPRLELRLLTGAAGLGEALGAAIEEAVRNGMIEELPDRAPAWRFTHELVRRVVYDRIQRIRRADLHLRIGETLERIHAVEPARALPELAYHFTLAAPVAGVERAVDYNVRAADVAIASFAFGEAAARLSSALELGIDDAPERARVQVVLGYLLYETGRFSESEAILAASLDAMTSLEERGLATRALVQRSYHRLMEDPEVDPASMVPVADDAIETFERLNDPLGLALAERLLARALTRQGRSAESYAAAERALEQANASGDRGTQRQAVQTLAWRLVDGSAPVEDAIVRLEEMLRASSDDHVLEAIVARFLSAVLAMAARFDEAREYLRTSGPVLDELNQTTHTSANLAMVAEAKELLGDRAGAERDLSTQWLSFRDARGDAPDTHALRAASVLALLYCDDGRWAEAAECLSYGRDVPEPQFIHRESILRLAGEARLAGHHGRHNEALGLARRAVESADRSDWLNLRARAWLALAEVESQAGHIAKAERATVKALALYHKKGNVAAAARLRARA